MPSTFSVGLYTAADNARARLNSLRQEPHTRYVCEYQQAHWWDGNYSLNLCGGPSFYRSRTNRLAPRLVPGTSTKDIEAGLCEITLVRLGNETAIYVDRAKVLHLPVESEVSAVGILFKEGSDISHIAHGRSVLHCLESGHAPRNLAPNYHDDRER